MKAVSWIDRFDGLADLAPDLRAELEARAAVVTLPQGRTAFAPGHSPENMLLLLSGTVRVYQVSEGGREIVLYRVEAGESCVLTTACLLAHEDYAAEGIAETDVEAVAIPRALFDDLLTRSQTFRAFVFAAYSQRIVDLFKVIDQVAFGRIDIRLAERLTVLSRGRMEVRTTHQQLASELGTAREVVSRQLQEFQRRGWITQSRGAIGLADLASLQDLAAAAG